MTTDHARRLAHETPKPPLRHDALGAARLHRMLARARRRQSNAAADGEPPVSAPEFPDALVTRAAEVICWERIKRQLGKTEPPEDIHLWVMPMEYDLARAVLLAVGPELQAAALREAARNWQRIGVPFSLAGQWAAWLNTEADHLAPAPANAQEAGR